MSSTKDAARLFAGNGETTTATTPDRPPILRIFKGDIDVPETAWRDLRLNCSPPAQPSDGPLWRKPAPPLPAPETYRTIDRSRQPTTASADLIKRIDHHLARACAWWEAPPDTAQLQAAVAKHGAGGGAGIIEAWIAEGRPGLWIEAWQAGLYSLEDLVASAVRTRTDHRLFRHLFGTFGQRPGDADGHQP